MIYLLLSILSSTIIMILFKWIEKLKVNLFIPIVANYLSASVLGFLLNGNNPISIINSPPDWLWLSLIIGLLLIVNFYLIGTSTQRAGIAITTIAAKMSFVIPVMFSIVIDTNDDFSIKKGLQISIAVIAVLLMVSKTKDKKTTLINLFLPLIIFIGLGVLDTIIKYCQYNYIHTESESAIFSAINFSISALIGLVILFFNPKIRSEIRDIKAWGIGFLLGIVNFGSMYFLINSLNSLKFNNSLVFGINNIGIVFISVLIALVFYREKLSKYNWIGVMLAILVLSIMLFSLQS